MLQPCILARVKHPEDRLSHREVELPLSLCLHFARSPVSEIKRHELADSAITQRYTQLVGHAVWLDVSAVASKPVCCRDRGREVPHAAALPGMW